MRKKKYFKAVYSAHIDFKDKEDLNRQLRPLKPGEHNYLKNERNVYYSDILETIKTAINAELKEELSKYTNLKVSDVQVQAVYEGSIAIVLVVATLQRVRDKSYRRRIEFASLLLYVLLLACATFLSRTVTEVYSYRLSAMNFARQAFALDGNLWDLIKGDFSLLRITDLCSLEGIVINILLFVPFGFLIARIWSLRWWQVMLIGMFTSATIELLQLVTKLGMLDVDDWIFNTMARPLVSNFNA